MANLKKGQRKAKKKENKEAIIFFCDSLKSKMLVANKKGHHFQINISEFPFERSALENDDYIKFEEGDRTITIILELNESK